MSELLRRHLTVPFLILVLFSGLVSARAEQLTALQVANHAYNAGFRGESLVIAVAIAGAESRFITDARRVNRDDSGNVLSTDRGLWQINDFYWRDVTTACADDPDCAARAAFRISEGGTSWSLWVAYTDGSYANFMPTARTAVQRLRHLYAQIEIDQFVDSDWRFQSAVSNLESNVDWLPEWELRYQTYEFRWGWHVTVFHLTSKIDDSRWIAFWDPWQSDWSWHQVE